MTSGWVVFGHQLCTEDNALITSDIVNCNLKNLNKKETEEKEEYESTYNY